MDFLALYAASPDWIKFALVIVYHFVLTGSAFMMGTLFSPMRQPDVGLPERAACPSPAKESRAIDRYYGDILRELQKPERECPRCGTVL